MAELQATIEELRGGVGEPSPADLHAAATVTEAIDLPVHGHPGCPGGTRRGVG